MSCIRTHNDSDSPEAAGASLYIPDLAQSDYYLFLFKTNNFGGEKFPSKEEGGLPIGARAFL